jgi:hypothetical protein
MDEYGDCCAQLLTCFNFAVLDSKIGLTNHYALAEEQIIHTAREPYEAKSIAWLDYHAKYYYNTSAG